MIALIPVRRYRVPYKVANGRPFSKFERLILEAIGSGVDTLTALNDTFLVHRRMVIESLVTLMHAGWIGLDGEKNRYVLTRAGELALADEGSVPKQLVLTARTSHVVMERVEGQLASSSDVRFVTGRKLSRYISMGVKIPSGDLPVAVEAGMVDSLLRCGKNEWIHWIDEITPDHTDGIYVLADVDTKNRKVNGLPSGWVERLSDTLFARAEAQERKQRAEGVVVDDRELRQLMRESEVQTASDSGATARHWTVPMKSVCIIAGESAHHALFQEILEEAKHYVVIMTPRLSIEGYERVSTAIQTALERGVHIDIIWGGESGAAKVQSAAALNALKKVEYDSHRNPASGRLVVARNPSGSGASVIVADYGVAYRAVVGSRSWLSPGSRDALHVSIQVTDPGPVAHLCRLVSDLGYSDERLASSGGIFRLRNAAASLERVQQTSTETSSEPLAAEASEPKLVLAFVHDGEHESVVRQVAKRRYNRLLMASQVWTSVNEAFAALGDALQASTPIVRAIYGETPFRDDERDSQAMTIERLGGGIQSVSNLAANFLIADDLFVVTSREWLTRRREQLCPRGNDLGILLRGTFDYGLLPTLFRDEKSPMP